MSNGEKGYLYFVNSLGEFVKLSGIAKENERSSAFRKFDPDEDEHIYLCSYYPAVIYDGRVWLRDDDEVTAASLLFDWYERQEKIYRKKLSIVESQMHTIAAIAMNAHI